MQHVGTMLQDIGTILTVFVVLGGLYFTWKQLKENELQSSCRILYGSADSLWGSSRWPAHIRTTVA